MKKASKKAAADDSTHNIDLNKEVRNLGIILIVLSIIHFIFSDNLSSDWGSILFIAGIIALCYRSKSMLLVLGIGLIIIGIGNILSVGYMEEPSGFWLIFGAFQIYWGIKEINRYSKVPENPRYVVKDSAEKGFVWYGLRIGLGTMLISWTLFAVFPAIYEYDVLFWPLATIYIVSSIFTFVASIIHLNKHKLKSLAVISLVLSTLGFIAFSVGVLIGYTGYVAEYDYSQQNEISTDLIENTLSPGYTRFYEFPESDYEMQEIDLTFESDRTISIYFVPSALDYEHYIRGWSYDRYNSCFRENRTYAHINCNVTTGGIIVANDGVSTAHYTIS